MRLKYYYLAVLLFTFSFSLTAQSKVGTVNINAVLTKMPGLKTAQEQLKVYNDKLNDEFEEKVKLYESKALDYKNNNASFSDVMKKTKQDEIIALEKEITNFRQNGATMSQIKQEELLRPLYNRISQTVNNVAKEKKFTQILTVDGNEFAYIDENYDITKDVMTKLGITN